MTQIRLSLKLTLLVTLLVASLSLVSCKVAEESSDSPLSDRTYEIAPGFREFYQTLGGEEVLGPGISKEFLFQEFECQYSANALMCLNPALSGSSRFGLYPLGNALNIREDPGSEAAAEGARVVEGYSIYEEFLPLFDQLSGARFAGNPISQVHINYPQQRVEQFFENVGLYRNFNEPTGSVRLLAYGAAACAGECDYSPNVEALLLTSSVTVENQPFLPQLGKLGGATAFGEPLTQPYIASDGAREQVYTNAVLYSPASRPNQVLLRSIVLELDMPHSDPGPKLYGNQDGVVFYAVEGDLGYHVPLIFDDFISAHGGLEISGDPVAEIIELDAGLYRQCFENYCLDYEPAAPAGEQVRLAPLGSQYLDRIQQSGSADKPQIISSATVEVKVAEQSKKILPSSSQKIDILIVNKSDQKPLSGIESELDLTLPDGTHYTTAITATRNDGTTSVIVPAMNTVPNGSILIYTVCLKAVSAQPVCGSGSYLVWNKP